MKRRVFWIVLDSLGIGAAPDADQFFQSEGGNDVGANTLGHIIDVTKGLNAPFFQQLGLANTLVTQENPEGNNLWAPVSEPLASYGRMKEVSAGKDTSSGHWELAGCPVPYLMPVYYEGLPKELLDEFIARVNREGIVLDGVLGKGKAASGTEIIKKLGDEHVKTGKPIVYTSMDSVFQIAAHEEVFGLEKLYKVCEIARALLNEKEDKIGRVIARPFVGATTQNFVRTANRKDYSLEPLGKTVLDAVKEQGLDVIGVGKIGDIFAHRGLTQEIKSKSNAQGMQIMSELILKRDWQGLAFVNLVDFDMLYGHRRDPQGYRKALEEVDALMPKFFEMLQEEDLVIIAADHGCDPTYNSTDHTREYVPLLVYKKNKPAVNLGIRQTFADVAATIAAYLDVDYVCDGRNLL
ncbi:phosphopentomutase [bacterium]|nr:phosphopentomutase [bacterium]MBU1918394.1 phosphopentomutase [bacterium]